jgi:D-arabinose 1-dehydrogenase-like Zn-dependent alcohol dehydrogenase
MRAGWIAPPEETPGMKITAAVLDRMGDRGPYAQTRPLRLAELELDAPRPGELLVRIDAAGLCHSDLSVINGDRPRPTPMALGHEAAATVLEAGDPDSPFAPGDKVVLAFLPACGHCVACSSGEGYLCGPGAKANGEGRLLRGGRRLHEHGGDVQHHLGVSAFATHAVVDQRSAVKIGADIPPETAALFGCAVLTGVGAVINTAVVRPGESAAVYGLGGVGLAAVLGALAAYVAEHEQRSPNGIRRENASYVTPVEPERITRPTLLIYGVEAAKANYMKGGVERGDFFEQLATDDKAFVILPGGDDFIHWQTGRRLLHRRVVEFLS